MKLKDCKRTLFAGMLLATAMSVVTPYQMVAQNTGNQQKAQATHVVKGVVTDDQGEPLAGAIVRVKNGSKLANVDMDGKFTLSGIPANAVLVVTYVGFEPQEIPVNRRTVINVKMKEENNTMNEVVVTAMGILRKEKSLTYATQQVKSEDLMRVQDPNVANSLEGKIAGIIITPSAGGAGGASKIMLRGNKSILGNSTPLIVVDGIPMNNSTRGQISSPELITYQGQTEGNDPLSMINPDDIESINVLKGANAAALYGSAAANGVLMITTKKGREGKLDITYTGNVTFDTPLMTPDIQGVYGAQVNPLTGTIGANGWGDKIVNTFTNAPTGTLTVAADGKYFPAGSTYDVHLRDYNNDDVKDFFRTGITTNNSVSLSGGTETIKTYFSAANSHALGMLQENNYNRNTLSFRQSYSLFKKRLDINVSLNYVQTKTNNRVGGGTVMNPIYHLYTTPRNIDMGYYKDNYMTANGTWMSNPTDHVWEKNSAGSYDWVLKQIELHGPLQNWAYMQGDFNNPYWLIKQNNGVDKDDRVYGSIGGNLKIWDGLSLQARYKYDYSRFDSESKRYATTFLPSTMEYVGRYWKKYNKTNESYCDVLLSYNKTFKEDWTVGATAGWVGHSINYENQSTSVNATFVEGGKKLNLYDRVNLFMTNAGDIGATTTSYDNNWDQAALATASLGWKEKIYIDGSYRRDWYKAYLQFEDRGTPISYGYYGVGGNAIVSELVKLPKWWNYFKYRLSYSEVGNSIPNIVFAKAAENIKTGAITPNAWAAFKDPRPETTGSMETGVEMQFFDDRLSFDLTFYNAISKNQYMYGYNASGKSEPVNSGEVRNRGFETTVAYNFRFGKDWRWKTSVNYSFNNNKILKTTYNADGSEKLIYKDVAGVRVRYLEGGSYGDMYVTDFRRNADGTFALNSSGVPYLDTDNRYSMKIGNMNAKSQLGWSNTISYKNFQLFFLINGRIGGKVISLTESYLDQLGLSQRSADARLAAEANGWYMPDGRPAMQLPDGSGRMIAVEDWYRTIGANGNQYMPEYVYSCTNFRLRELSLSYMFRNLLGNGKNLSLSFIARNLFFLYKEAPVDPDISLSTANGLGAFEVFNMPSTRSYGLNVKLNF